MHFVSKSSTCFFLLFGAITLGNARGDHGLQRCSARSDNLWDALCYTISVDQTGCNWRSVTTVVRKAIQHSIGWPCRLGGGVELSLTQAINPSFSLERRALPSAHELCSRAPFTGAPNLFRPDGKGRRREKAEAHGAAERSAVFPRGNKIAIFRYYCASGCHRRM